MEEKCEDLKKVVVGDDLEKFFQIGAQLPPRGKEELIDFLRRNADVFAWNACEAPGVDLSFICHHLNVNPSITPKKQPHRHSSKDHSDAVRDEVKKLKQAGAIKEVFYPEWLANTMVIKKKEWEIASVCRLYELEQSLCKRSFLPTSNRPIGRCNSRPSSDDFLRSLPRIPPDTTGPRRSREDSFCHLHWKLPLQGDAFWSKECGLYSLKDDD